MTTEQLTWITCGLCGETGPSTDVLRRATTWHEQAAKAIGRPVFDVLDRCRDEQGCRRRVEQVLGEPWPLNDRTVATVAPGMGGQSSDATAGVGPRGSRVPGDSGSNVSADEPMPPAAVPAAVAGEEEDIEWMR